MNGWARECLAPMIAAIFVMLLATPSFACDTTTGCPAGSSNTDSLPANMLPTYADAKPQNQETAAPINLKKFTKKPTRSARRASSRKALASKASRSKQATIQSDRKKIQAEVSDEPSTQAKVAPSLANAKAELTDVDAAATAAADQAALANMADAPAPAPSAEPAAAAENGSAPSPAQKIDVVAAEDFNEVDGAAWESPQPPRLMQLTSLDSHAEMRPDDSKWNHTSTIGKVFVALGALLTIGSAIRMLIA